jgi:hypothetical protein
LHFPLLCRSSSEFLIPKGLLYVPTAATVLELADEKCANLLY